jgi:prepilin-type N-terminal cleavage/methylation domain-containing protein
MRIHKSPSLQRGFTLIETMFAVTILMIGVSGTPISSSMRGRRIPTVRADRISGTTWSRS